MKERYLSLDFLRGLTIFGMVFSAIIPYKVLPAWMYHIQNPPPSHELDMSVSGIGWVDLVFPIFIFCMGVAIPLSGRSKTEKGFGGFSYFRSAVERFFMLWLFSYAYVLMNFNNLQGFWPQIATLAGFFLFFPLYMVINKGNCNSKLLKYLPCLRVVSLLLICGMIYIGHRFFGEQVNVQRRGIIIFLLAFLYLFGSLIWYITRDKLRLRLLIFCAIFLFTYITKELEWPVITYANKNIRWWFNIEYIYFLLLLLPATYVGDLLYKKMKSLKERGTSIYGQLQGRSIHLLFPALLLFVCWLCFAFYMNLNLLNLIVSLVVIVALTFYVYKKIPLYKEFVILADVLLVCGLLILWPEGGIKKVPCTISYCLSTCSISIFLLMASDYICKYIPGSLFVKSFCGAGQNPLMSYIAYESFMVPLMKITGFIAIYRAAYPVGMPLFGLLRAAIAVLFTMWCVSQMSRRKIFWKA